LFSKRSIRSRFLIQLIVASAALIVIFSSILYFYIQNSIYDEKRVELLLYAQNVSAYQSIAEAEQYAADNLLGLSVEMLSLDKTKDHQKIYEYREEGKTYLTLIYPFDSELGSYLRITKNITPTTSLLAKILHSIFIINAIGFILIIIYAIALSKMLISPIRTLSLRLSNMNENMIRPIRIEALPEEFEPLGETINRLIGRIQNFVKYQKELFIGAAHELKTPLAVIKLKNQVTLIKKREPQEYIDAIKVTNESVNEMNKIVTDILNVGRQEGAQLETPVQSNVIEVLRKKANDFVLLAESENKALEINFRPDVFMATLQENLLNQIVQNFLQNALKFTPQGKKVLLRSRPEGNNLLIEVIDEGIGIDDTVDLFAPFKRQGNKSGVGLGLFLAKSAADALGAEISLYNRNDGKDGTVASLLINSKLCCPLP
jgi:two-component system OmpR family sensor kinase